MELHWLKKEGAPSLVVFVLGWAASHRWVEHIRPRGFDVLCVCDLRDMAPLALPEYRHKVLLAWSFGIWAAEHLFEKDTFARAIALCGSPLPTSDKHGLGLRRAKLTLRSLPEGLPAFYRACLGPSFERFAPGLPSRSPEALYQELDFLLERSSQSYAPKLPWNAAVLGERDTLFPLAKLLDYWGEKALVMPFAHYPFADEATVRGWIGKDG